MTIYEEFCAPVYKLQKLRPILGFKWGNIPDGNLQNIFTHLSVHQSRGGQRSGKQRIVVNWYVMARSGTLITFTRER